MRTRACTEESTEVWRPFISYHQCDQNGEFIGLCATFYSLWQQLICPNLPHSYAIFVKVLKSIIFLVKSFLDNFYRHLAIFSGHTGYQKKIVSVPGGLSNVSVCYCYCKLVDSNVWPWNGLDLGVQNFLDGWFQFLWSENLDGSFSSFRQFRATLKRVQKNERTNVFVLHHWRRRHRRRWRLGCLRQTVWPDWAIFERSLPHIFLQK